MCSSYTFARRGLVIKEDLKRRSLRTGRSARSGVWALDGADVERRVHRETYGGFPLGREVEYRQTERKIDNSHN